MENNQVLVAKLALRLSRTASWAMNVKEQALAQPSHVHWAAGDAALALGLAWINAQRKVALNQ